MQNSFNFHYSRLNYYLFHPFISVIIIFPFLQCFPLLKTKSVFIEPLFWGLTSDSFEVAEERRLGGIATLQHQFDGVAVRIILQESLGMLNAHTVDNLHKRGLEMVVDGIVHIVAVGLQLLGNVRDFEVGHEVELLGLHDQQQPFGQGLSCLFGDDFLLVV